MFVAQKAKIDDFLLNQSCDVGRRFEKGFDADGRVIAHEIRQSWRGDNFPTYAAGKPDSNQLRALCTASKILASPENLFNPRRMVSASRARIPASGWE